ncbi:hypothetical protein L227DRAFT_653641 [Lentinus tigrinus ALCF2SS1-6]|uniref:Uncharacterized protein n=1 Tax=Lentinus tigrinus ALCF2SS1-6 TaxID=1328759 RepID=A0A5C2SAI2_9APHY|nr:hypothetical protein L227DRAFT_653641 [Lentinus tigrinus ALCF2SS1-6]
MSSTHRLDPKTGTASPARASVAGPTLIEHYHYYLEYRQPVNETEIPLQNASSPSAVPTQTTHASRVCASFRASPFKFVYIRTWSPSTSLESAASHLPALFAWVEKVPARAPLSILGSKDNMLWHDRGSLSSWVLGSSRMLRRLVQSALMAAVIAMELHTPLRASCQAIRLDHLRSP